MRATNDDRRSVLKARDARGSRLHCLILTSMPRDRVASSLNDLVSPVAAVTADDHWMPEGFMHPAEARLDEPGSYPFVPEPLQHQLKSWWLKRPHGANTPNWDLASTCRIDGREGLLLIEAKAHNRELKEEGKPPGDRDNDEQIGAAIEEANRGLNAMAPGWHLSRKSQYQLSNRFAWAWKLAALGTPTILVYVGFLHATEMADQGQPFTSAAEWDALVRNYASESGIVPKDVFERPLQTSSAPMWALIRSLDLKWLAAGHLGKPVSPSPETL